VADLKFRPDSSYQEDIAKGLKQSEVPVIKNSQIYRAMPYQAFNTGRSVGLLNIVSPSQQVENMQFESHEIVILQQSYPDISPVAGIITTRFSTPLSHVNLRATAWSIPNASLKTALQDYGKFNNKWVYLEVTEQALSLRLATDAEIQQEQQKQQSAKQVKLPQSNLQFKGLDVLKKISLEDAQKFGAKTAHLGEMQQAGFPVPNGFGIPFYYYQQHITQHLMDIGLQGMLNDERFKKNKVWRKQKLLELQAKIKNTPIDPVHFAAIKKQWNEVLDGSPVFVRSSTNAEDLAGFNGAGLYDTVPNVKSDIALEAAIKKVWASLWNERAVSERAFFGIPQKQVYAAVLIQTGVNATASGVLLTTDIWGHQPRTFTLNAKWGLGMRVVEGQKIAEQILYDTGNDGTRVISRSDEDTMLVFDAKGGTREIKVPRSEAIITEQRAKKLGALAQHLEALFPSYKVLDIEWVLEKTNLGQDKFWLVQARPYID
jgi:pyruvate, water dikinase